MRVDLRPSDDSSLTWSGREGEEGVEGGGKRGKTGREREREKRRRGGEGGSKENQKEGGRVEKGKGGIYAHLTV